MSARELGNVTAAPFTVNGSLTQESCRCWPFNEVLSCGMCPAGTIAEQSPRNPYFPDATCPGTRRGKVWIKDSNGLVGQVIINGAAAAYSPAAHWSGEVDIGFLTSSPACPGKIISRDAGPSEYKAPAYGIPSQSLGGGAVGLVPYRLYDNDCAPPHFNDWRLALDNATWPTCAEPLLLNSRFNGPVTTPTGTLPQQSATIRFYGPVWTEAPLTATLDEQPYVISYYVNASPLLPWADVTGAFNVQLNRNPGQTFSREIILSHNNNIGDLAEGYYAIVFNTTPRDEEHPRYPLLCEGTTAVPPPAPRTNYGGQVVYHFRLYPDCNVDGCIDATDHRCGDGPGCPADLDNGTGTGVPDDAVDVSDLLFFLARFEEGHEVVDLDNGSGTGTPDGGVDINDLLFFLTRFEEGC